MTYHLISHHLCPYVQRAVIVLEEKGIRHARTYIDLSARPAWFPEVSPLGKVPVLQTRGRAIFESQVIAEYLDEVTDGSLHPGDPLERARHRSWIAFASETLNATGGFYSASSKMFDEKYANLSGMFARVEAELRGPYFAGNQFHMVDAAWAPVFRYLNVFDQIEGLNLLINKPKCREWRGILAERVTVRQAVPEGYEERLAEFLCKRSSELGRRARLTPGLRP